MKKIKNSKDLNIEKEAMRKRAEEIKHDLKRSALKLEDDILPPRSIVRLLAGLFKKGNH